MMVARVHEHIHGACWITSNKKEITKTSEEGRLVLSDHTVLQHWLARKPFNLCHTHKNLPTKEGLTACGAAEKSLVLLLNLFNNAVTKINK